LTYAISWGEAAINAAARFLEDDPEGLRHLMEAVDLLAGQPGPEGTVAYGAPDLRRMHVGRYRVLYHATRRRPRRALPHHNGRIRSSTAPTCGDG
jgi:mRNA interferase RelE/StbE